jgi:hypothetical protein
VLPAANSNRIQPTDFDHSSELVAQAHIASRRSLADSASKQPVPLLAAA